jgi:hypothetical protein
MPKPSPTPAASRGLRLTAISTRCAVVLTSLIGATGVTRADEAAAPGPADVAAITDEDLTPAAYGGDRSTDATRDRRRTSRYRLGGSTFVIVPGAIIMREAPPRARWSGWGRRETAPPARLYDPGGTPRRDARLSSTWDDRAAWEALYRAGPPRDGYRYRWSGPRYGVWMDDPRLAYGWRRY